MKRNKKKKKATAETPQVAPNIETQDLVTPQYRHIKELAELKFDAEERREQNLIQQSSQMQTAFSFMTAAIFMAVPVCIEHRGTISLEFFLISTSIIVLFLIVSLVLSSFAQWRWKTTALPDIHEIKKSVLDNPEWKKLCVEYHQINQWIDAIGSVQKNKSKLNDRRVKLIMGSMICFYISLGAIIISFVVALYIMIL